ncbi:hypothetical protein E2C01_052181 [Portunus trituberculatus]|uniref:Tyr recombinase domain-containing protein n=1 Tax=Portunus trituberculatus TaxID=210409 RepID=A0A5B7GKV9_PORTR|nr:hypothetical protein [Portunus trituberculatus]
MPSASAGTWSPRASADRVGTVKRYVKYRDFSSKVEEFLVHDKRPSTSLNYQHKWKRYRKWFKDNRHTISNPTVQKVAHFLVFLPQDCHLSTSVIKGYKAMLNSVLAIQGLDLNNDQVLRLIIRACSSQPQRPSRNLLPSWNLDVVLRFLTTAPFEPMRLSSIRDLTRKSLFLLALATAQRVREIQALSHKMSWQGQDQLVSYLPEFIAKTDTDAHSTPWEFRIKSLSTVVGSQDVERLLCPVWALRHYLHKMALPTRSRNLFLAVRCPSRPMSKGAISFLRDIIKSAHTSFPDSSRRELKVRAHDIRGIATSMLLRKNCSVPTILRAACWRTPSVFADHYLREIVRQEGDIFALGPVVAAGHVVD